MIDKRNTANQKHVKRARDRNTAADIAMDDDDEKGKSERASLNMRMRIGRGEGVKEHSCKNGDRREVFTSQQKQ